MQLIQALTTWWRKNRLAQRARLGEQVRCGPRTSIYLEGARKDQVIIGNYVTLLEAELRCYRHGRIAIDDYSWFSLRTQIISCSSVTIGKYCIVGRDVYISDTNEHPLDPVVRREQTLQYLQKGLLPDRYAAETSPIVIQDDVWVGERAFILKGVTVGQGAVVAAGTVVTKSVPAYSIVAGNPAQVVKMISPSSRDSL
ncbi:MAG: acyltransferase [Desulfobaccales bacterium]